MAKKRTSRRPKRGSKMPRRNAKKVKPDWHLIKVSERQHWSDDVKAKTEEIYSVYAYDKNLHVHVASLTPSYELWAISYDYEPTPSVADDDEAREDLDETIMDGWNSAFEAVTYMDVNSVERILKAHPERGRSVNKYIDFEDAAEVAADKYPGERGIDQAVVEQLMEGWGTGALMY